MVQTQGQDGPNGRRAIDHDPADRTSNGRGNDRGRTNDGDVPCRTRDGARRGLAVVEMVNGVAPGLEREDGENDGKPDETQLPAATWQRSSPHSERHLGHCAEDTIPNAPGMHNLGLLVSRRQR